MSKNASQRNYIRFNQRCEMHYKFLDSDTLHQGICTSLSGSGVFFNVDHPIANGKALEIKIASQSSMTSDLTAFIEVVRTTPLKRKLYEIDGSIKSIKAN